MQDGTWARPFLAPLPQLRPLLKPGAEFPPTPEQDAAIEALKALLVDTHKLGVPGEEAAIRAAAAWQSGSPPEGRPYEAGVDTSKIAMGGHGAVWQGRGIST